MAVWAKKKNGVSHAGTKKPVQKIKKTKNRVLSAISVREGR
jgi:hypothetical protein